MKKLYSIVLMAAALLVGTNVWAVDVSSWDNLKASMKNGGEITLTASFEVTAPSASTDATWAGIWIGAETEDGTAPNVVLNLNGKTITINAGRNNQVLYPFVLTKGSLVVNGPGKIVVTKGEFTKLGEGTNVFFVFGQGDAEVASLKDPKTDPYSHLTIGRNVEVATANGSCIVVDQLTSTHKSYINKVYTTDPAKQLGYTIANYAFGARVDVDGKLSSIGGTKCYGIKANGNLKTPADEKKMYAPYICILDSAEIYSDNSAVLTASTAVYASGYAQWTIKGKCEGATGLYASSGKIEVEGADIASQATDYAAPGGTGHANGLGSAIVINSRTNYGGEVELEVSGDTHVESKSGFAIEEVVNTANNQTKVEAITINAGTFQGGTNPNTGEDQAAIIMSNQTSTDADVVVYGGTIEGPVVVNGDDGKSLNDFLGPEVHTTTVYINGNPNTVVSTGDVPDVYASIAGHANEAVKWSGDNETLIADIILAELEINKMDTTWNSGHTKITAITPHAQVLYVGDANHNVTLKVGRVVLGPGAQVIVNAGSKLIVDGEQGFVAASANNFLLKTEEGNPAIFLFHPNVTSNRNPKATVEFISKSCYRYPDHANIYQRFGIPMKKGGLESISAQDNHETRFFAFDYNTGDWKGLGYINPSAGYESQALDINTMNNPFEYYQLLDFVATTPTSGTKYTMVGSLLGNTEPTMNILENSWKGFANSYMGQISLAELIALIPNTVDKAIYTYDVTANNATWEAVTNLNSANAMLNPLQPFLIRNRYEAANVELDYEHAVYNPTLGIKNNAPRRAAAASNITMAKIAITNEDSKDYVIVAEGEDFSAGFDNGYDASKFMNDGINMYVSADEKMSIFATDNLDNTYVGIKSVDGGNYTITFADVKGAELILTDHETGARVAMVEGNTYEFTAAANSVNDYRFEIVESAKLPTAIENTEAVKSAKGVYTITGQYVGEMNVWNTLPAGIYVVNGEKRVK